jgi:hypothetical protein
MNRVHPVNSMTRSKGWGTRYDRGSYDHLENERAKNSATGVYVNYNARRCTRCGLSKPVKGGKGKRTNGAWVGWTCAGCLLNAESES